MTTWSDGENGGWFRQTHEPSGFFGHFFAPAMERVRGGKSDVIPVTLSAYLGRHPPTTEAQVQTGAWNIGSSAGYDFSRWIGSPAQHRAGDVVNEVSRRYWELRRRRRPPRPRESSRPGGGPRLDPGGADELLPVLGRCLAPTTLCPNRVRPSAPWTGSLTALRRAGRD